MRRVFLITGLIFLFSCKKQEDGAADSQMPMIKLETPAHQEVFAAGKTVNINATISDNQILKELHLEVINSATNAILIHEHYAPGSPIYTLKKSFTAQPSATYLIKVEAKDAKGNRAKAEVNVSSN